MKRTRNTSRSVYRLIQRKVEKECRKVFLNASSAISNSSDSDSMGNVSGRSRLQSTWCKVPSSCQNDHSSSDDSIKGLSEVGIADIPVSDSESDNSFSVRESLSEVSFSTSDCSSCKFSDADENIDDKPNFTAPFEPAIVKTSWREKIREWAVLHQVSHAALGDLLKLIKPEFQDLPLDPKTVLKTGKRVDVENMGQGVYYNFGLKDMLLKRLRECNSLEETVWLNFNIDSLPLYKSTATSFTPILGLIVKSGLPPFICAIYYGPEKPTIDMLLKDFAPDLENLLDNGIEVDGKHYKVDVNAFVCDMPARAYVKCTPGHRGFFSCERCTQRGFSYKNRTVFDYMIGPLRTDETFLTYSQPAHHNGISPLTDIGIPMVTKFVLDYMHLVCLGVVRKLLFRWLKKKKKYKLSNTLLSIIERTMHEAAKMWPCDFSRKPRRSFSDLKRWKATELRQFLLYVGPVIMRKHFPKVVYEHFLLLHAAMTIFLREDLHDKLHAEAVAMLEDFVRKGKSAELYGREFVISNVHQLIHLGDDVKRYGALDNVSSFVFENELHRIKRCIRGKTRPLQQLINRVNTVEDVKPKEMSPATEGLVPTSKWRGGATAGMSGGNHYSKFLLKKRLLSLRNGDNFAMLQDSSVIMILNFYETQEGLYAVGKRFTQYRDLYSEPIESSRLGIFIAENLSDFPRKFKVEKLKCKCLVIPCERATSYAVFPLMN